MKGEKKGKRRLKVRPPLSFNTVSRRSCSMCRAEIPPHHGSSPAPHGNEIKAVVPAQSSDEADNFAVKHARPLSKEVIWSLCVSPVAKSLKVIVD